MNKRTPNFSQKGFTGNFLEFMKRLERNEICCLDFLSQIYTANTADIIMSGTGTEDDPLKATLVTPGGGGIGTLNKAINGLNINPSDTVKLGGNLTEATNITQTATSNYININGFAGGQPFRITNGAIPLIITGATTQGANITSSAVGVLIQAGGTGLSVLSSVTGLLVTSTTVGANFAVGSAPAGVSNGSAVIASQSTPFVPVAMFQKTDVGGSISGQAIPLDGIIMRRNNGASVAIPIGAGVNLKFQMQQASTINESGRIAAVATSLGAANSEMQFWTQRASSIQHTTLLSSGQVQFNQYVAATPFTGTAAYGLAIDNTGKILMTAVPAAPLFTTVNNGIEINTNVLQLGGALIKPTIISSASASNTLTLNGELSAIEGFVNINGTDNSFAGLAPLIVNRNSIVTNAPTDSLILREEVASFNGGEGTAIKFQLKDTATTVDIGRITISDTTGGQGFSTMQFLVADANVLTASLTLPDTGQIQFNRYTGTAFAGTPVRSIGLDASGNIVTAAPIVIPTIPVQSANNGLTLNGTTVQLGGTLLQATSITTGAFGLTFNRTGGGSVIINGTTNSTNPALTITGENSTLNITGNMNTGGNTSALYVGPTVNTTANGVVIFDVFPTITATGSNPLLIRSTNGTPAISFKHYVDGKVTVGDDTGINNSAKFAVSSTTQGFLPPRMTTAQKNAIASPLPGLVVFDTSVSKLSYQNNLSQWVDLPGANVATVINSAAATVPVTAAQSGNIFTNEGATANVQFNLPAATVGLFYEFVDIVDSPSNLIIKTNGTDTIQNGSQPIIGTTATSSAIGGTIKLVCYVAGKWVGLYDNGGSFAISA